MVDYYDSYKNCATYDSCDLENFISLFVNIISGSSNVINPLSRQVFTPLRDAGEKPSLEKLMNSLYVGFPQAAAFEYVDTPTVPVYGPHEDFNVGEVIEVITSTKPPPSLSNLASKVKDVEEFLHSLPNYTKAEVESIEKNTRGQALNDQWISQRVGRITGSKMHAVYTKVNTLQNPNSERSKDVTKLLDQLCGIITVNPDIPALKYGRMMELVARKLYCKISNGHINLSVEECGLFVMQSKIYIGASPDAVVKCDCCGEGLLEIKCPASVAHEEPSAENLSYIQQHQNGHDLNLNKSHAYFTQIQGQLAVTNRQWCDFFVYTSKGHILERIYFDETHWNKIESNISYFYKNFLAPYFVRTTNAKDAPEVHGEKKLGLAVPSGVFDDTDFSISNTVNDL